MQKKDKKKLLALIMVILLIASLLVILLMKGHTGKKQAEEHDFFGTIDILPDEEYYIKINGSTHGLEYMALPDPLTEEIRDAIGLVPEWLRLNLTRKLHDLALVYINTGGNSFPAFADLDNDDDLDMIVGRADGTLDYFVNTCSVFRSILERNDMTFSGIDVIDDSAPALADLDADGDYDMIVGSSDGNLRYFENKGTPEESSWLEDKSMFAGIDVGTNSYPALADMDSDGDLDLTVGGTAIIGMFLTGPKLFYFENVGGPENPSWQEDNSMYNSLLTVRYNVPALGDLDNDGDFDIVLGGEDGNLTYIRNDGTSILGHRWIQDPTVLPLASVGQNSAPTLIDIDGDTCLDLIVGSGSGYIHKFINSGTPNEPKWLYLCGSMIYDSASSAHVVSECIGEGRKQFLGPEPLNIDRRMREVDLTDAALYANMIWDAEEKYVDELAFTIAHTATNVLRVMSGSISMDDPEVTYDPYVLAENVEGIYQLAGKLGYTDIVERDDYTTLMYRGDDGGKNEMPKGIYYWYVVHPRTRFEAPGLVQGDFWRDYLLYNHRNSTALSLFEAVSDAPTVTSAAMNITEWMRTFMDFGYESTDKQPIEIYDAHYGSCGEWSILTTALGRAALIPTRLANDWGEDHVWNEFYDQYGDLEWHHWDSTGPSIDDPTVYEEGGKDISTVWSIRGDDYIYPITGPYTDTAHVTIEVKDKNGRGVDGAYVIMESEYFMENNPAYWPVPALSIWNHTEVDGSCTFELGKNDYWIIVMSKVGNVNYELRGIEEGESYTIDLRVGGEMPEQRSPAKSQIPGGSIEVEIAFELLPYHQYPINVMQYPDPYVVITGNIHPQPMYEEPVIDIIVCDCANFIKYRAGLEFEVREAKEYSRSATDTFQIPDNGEDWYIVFSNHGSLETVKTLMIAADVM